MWVAWLGLTLTGLLFGSWLCMPLLLGYLNRRVKLRGDEDFDDFVNNHHELWDLDDHDDLEDEFTQLDHRQRKQKKEGRNHGDQ